MKTETIFLLRGKLYFLRPCLYKEIKCVTNLRHLEGTWGKGGSHGRYVASFGSTTQASTDTVWKFFSKVASNSRRTRKNPWPNTAGWSFDPSESLLPWFPQSPLLTTASTGLGSVVSSSEFNTSSSFSQVQA